MSEIEGGDAKIDGPADYTFDDYMNEEVGTERLVQLAVSFSEYASDEAEFYRALIRACLRELDEEREALATGIHACEGTIIWSRPAAKTLRSILPETEGEA